MDVSAPIPYADVLHDTDRANVEGGSFALLDNDVYQANYTLCPMSALFIHRYLTNIVDQHPNSNEVLGPEALEVPLRLISKDVNLLIATYNSLRSAYENLKRQSEMQQQQLESFIRPQLTPTAEKEESLREWEMALQNLQEEWMMLQDAVDQASWSLFVLTQREKLSNSTNTTRDLSSGEHGFNAGVQEQRPEEILANKEEAFQSELRQQPTINEKVYQAELASKDALIASLRETIATLEASLSLIANESEYKKSPLMEEYETKRTQLENEFLHKSHALERSIEEQRKSLNSDFTSIKNQLHSDYMELEKKLISEFEQKKASIIASEQEFAMTIREYQSQLSDNQSKLVQLQSQLDEKEREISSLKEQLLQQSANAPSTELKEYELKALSLHLEDLQRQLTDRESKLEELERQKQKEFDSREAVLSSMEASLLSRTKEEEAAMISRASSNAAITEELKKKRALLDSDRAALEADKEALVSLTSLLEERKSAIEASLLAQSESIEAEKNRFLAEKALFESQRREIEEGSQIEQYQNQIKELQTKIKELETTKSRQIEEEESFLSIEEKVSPSTGKSRSKGMSLLASPIHSRTTSNFSRPFKSPGGSRRKGAVSQSFRKMLTKLVSSEAKTFNKKEEKSDDLASDLSTLSYVDVQSPEKINLNKTMEEKEPEENHWIYVGESPDLKQQFLGFRRMYPLYQWPNFATQLKKNVAMLCTYLKKEQGHIEDLSKALEESEKVKDEYIQQIQELKQENERMKQRHEAYINQLKIQVKADEESYQRLVSEMNEIKEKMLLSEQRRLEMEKENKRLSDNHLLLEECSSILLSIADNERPLSVENNSFSISTIVKYSLSDIDINSFILKDIISHDETTDDDGWLELMESRLISKPNTTMEAIDLFISIVESKISTITRKIIENEASVATNQTLAETIAQILRRISRAVFLFSIGIFKSFYSATLQPSSPTALQSSSMANERIQALELALRAAEDEKKAILRESNQNIARIATLTNELAARSDRSSAAYWKERCRAELDHRSDLVFQKRYLVLEITCLRSNEMLLLSLLDQLSDSIPTGVLSPTPGLMSPTKITRTTASFPIIARSVLACVRWVILTRRRAKLLAAALSR